MTDYLSRHRPGPAVEVAPAVLVARAALAEATADLSAVPDASLEAAWPWRGEDADVRYGLYRIPEALEEAAANVARAQAEGNVARSPAARRIAAATAARWELHGLLAGLTADDLDADPGGGEWTIRQTLGHIVLSQRAYGDGTAWWLMQPADAEFPTRLPEAVVGEMAWPTEEEDGMGSLAEIRARLDGWLDLDAGAFAELDDAALARRGRWSGIAVDVGFRIGRWASHLAEHTLQIDKTLVKLGRSPSEVQRLIRLIHAAWGRVEALVFPMPAAELERSGRDGRSTATIIVAAAAEMKATAASVRSAALEARSV
jgi:DinB family protein